MPTSLAIIGGRTYVSGPDDYAAVHALQDQYRLVPLEEWGSDWAPPAEVPVAAGRRHQDAGPRQVLAMTPEVFFGRLNALLPANPAYPADAPVHAAHRQRWASRPAPSSPGRASTPDVQQAITAGVEAGKQAIRDQEAHLGEHVNGWQVTLDLGRYGTRYAYRAAWTFFGVGGNLIEDACYPLAITDGTASRSTARTATRCTSSRDELPPVERLLVADHVRPRELPGRQRDRPLRARRPQRPQLTTTGSSPSTSSATNPTPRARRTGSPRPATAPSRSRSGSIRPSPRSPKERGSRHRSNASAERPPPLRRP